MPRVSVSDNTQPCLPSLCSGTFQTKMMHNDARTKSSTALLLDIQFGDVSGKRPTHHCLTAPNWSPRIRSCAHLSLPSLGSGRCPQTADSAVPPAHVAQQLEHRPQGLHTLPLTSCPLSTGCTGSDFAPTWASLHPMLSQTGPRGRSLCCSPGLPPHAPLSSSNTRCVSWLTHCLVGGSGPFLTGQNSPAIRPLEIRCSSWGSCKLTRVCAAV